VTGIYFFGQYMVGLEHIRELLLHLFLGVVLLGLENFRFARPCHRRNRRRRMYHHRDHPLVSGFRYSFSVNALQAGN